MFWDVFYKKLVQFFKTQLFADNNKIALFAEPVNNVANSILNFYLRYISNKINAYILLSWLGYC